MNRYRHFALALTLVPAFVSCLHPSQTPDQSDPSAAQPPEGLTPAREGVLYAIGVGFGSQLDPLALNELEARELTRGVLDALLKEPEAIEIIEQQEAFEINAFWELRMRELAEAEERAGHAFLTAAAAAPGATTKPSGLVVTVLEEGEGPSPGIFDWVLVHYEGRLRDGSVFDANPEGQPTKLRLGKTVKCWQEALGMIGAGGRVHFVCPPALAYQEGGIPGRVPGGAVLDFEVELVEVIPGEDPTK